jgi:tripartite ATP-independent transporter DctP family solute receptor
VSRAADNQAGACSVASDLSSSPPWLHGATKRGYRVAKAIRSMSIAALAFAACAPKAHSEPVTLMLAHAAMPGHPGYVAAAQFARRVEERTFGQVKIEVFAAGRLGSASEILQKVKLGAVDMIVTSPYYLIRNEKAFAVLLMPYLFDSYEHAYRVLDGPAMTWLAPLAEKHGFVMLSNWEWGFLNITNNKRPIYKPEDVHGLKIRVAPGPELEHTMEALGAEITRIGVNELYTALSQGVVDGQDNPLNSIYYVKLYEVQKHLALTRHAYYNMVHFMSAKSWANLTPEQKTVLREESKAAGDGMRKKVVGEEEDLIVKMVEAGVTVTRPDRDQFRALMEPAYQAIKLYAGEDNVRTFTKMVEDERKP